MRPRIALNASLMAHGLEQGLAFTVKTAYADAVARAGGIPVILPLLEDRQALGEALQGVQGLMLIGGDDLNAARYGEANSPLAVTLLPRREAFDFAALAAALELNLPVLGICLGCQAINVHYGGTLYQDLLAERPESTLVHSRKSPPGFVAHEVAVRPGTLLAGIVGEGALPANSGHHQAIRTLGAGLRVSAEAPDGLVEAIEDPSRRFVLGVQWHPEAMDEERQRKLFSAFVEAAGDF